MAALCHRMTTSNLRAFRWCLFKGPLRSPTQQQNQLVQTTSSGNTTSCFLFPALRFQYLAFVAFVPHTHTAVSAVAATNTTGRGRGPRCSSTAATPLTGAENRHMNTDTLPNAPTFQNAIQRGQEYWACVGCSVMQSSNTEGITSKGLPQVNIRQRATNFKNGVAGSCLICEGTKFDEPLSTNAVAGSNNACGSHVNRWLGASVTYGKFPNLVSKNSFMAPRRHFASGPNDDDVEARLMREDDNREGMLMNGPVYGMAGSSFDDYHEEQPFDQFGEESSLEKHGHDMQAKEGDDGSSDVDSEGNDPSDEEFEGERSDEELDELLANTPLFDPPEFQEDGAPEQEYSFRPEGPVYYPGMEYDPEDLDITRPLAPRRREPREKQTFSVEEVIEKADFRNVRFLTKFIGETGNILARKEFKMRNKSHGRITKAIKTARFFGLMPYTNMGRPKYVFNEPFDEFSEFYETDEDEGEMADNETGIEGRFQGSSAGDGRFIRRFPQRRGGFSGPGMGRGGFSGAGMGRR